MLIHCVVEPSYCVSTLRLTLGGSSDNESYVERFGLDVEALVVVAMFASGATGRICVSVSEWRTVESETTGVDCSSSSMCYYCTGSCL